MASIQKRGNRYSVVFRDANNRQRRVSVSGNRKQAERVAATIDSLLNEIRLGRIDAPKNAPVTWYTSGGRLIPSPQTQVTFGSAVDAWHRQQTVPATTATLIAIHVRLLKSFFGAQPLSGLTEQSIQGYVDHRKQAIIGRTIRRELCTLRSLLKSRKIKVDWSEIRIPHDPPTKPYAVMRDDDVTGMIAAVAGTVLSDALIVVAGTGMRRSELCRLKASDLTDDGLIVCELKRSRGKGWTTRTIPVSQTVRDTLLRRIEQTPDGRTLFPSADEMGRALSIALKCTAYEGRGFHDLRRRAASKMVSCGVPIPAAAALLGHTVEVMLRVYVRPYEEDMRRAADML